MLRLLRVFWGKNKFQADSIETRKQEGALRSGTKIGRRKKEQGSYTGQRSD